MDIDALAADYDGTLARDGRIDPETIAALGRFRSSGRRLVMVTGREWDELRECCQRLDLFDLVVAENGALIADPGAGTVEELAERPPDAFVRRLRECGVGPISVGRVVVATWRPHDEAARAVIGEMGLDLRVILNKRAVMILPAGVDKGSGLRAASARLGIEPGRVVAVGDAENDRELFGAAGAGVAVANAAPGLIEAADRVTRNGRGAGVAELIDGILDGRFGASAPGR